MDEFDRESIIVLSTTLTASWGEWKQDIPVKLTTTLGAILDSVEKRKKDEARDG
jgi:hypothetical protein